MLTFPRAFLKCISDEARWAGAGRDVVEDAALGVGTTGARARVHALAVGAGLLPRAVRVQDTLRAAALVGVSEEPRRAGAGASTVRRLGFCTRSTGVRVAYVRLRGYWPLLIYFEIDYGYGVAHARY
jgi:hypothetical protein